MKTRSIAAAAALGAALCPTVARVRADETQADNVARLEQMSVAEKQELAQKRSRFVKLSRQEQERLRNLCHDIESRPDAYQLLEVMRRYHEWLKTLSSNQLAELRELPEEKKLPYIKEVRKQQQQKEFLRIAREASPEDLETVFNWLQDYVYAHREQLLKGLPGDFGKRMAAMKDKDRQTLILVHVVIGQPPHSPLRPGREEVEELIPRLSPESQKVFNETTDLFTRIQLISIWSWGALWSKAFPNVNSGELAAFFQKLPVQERDRLEKMPAADRELELKRLYSRANFFRSGEIGTAPWESRDRGGPRRGRPNEDLSNDKQHALDKK